MGALVADSERTADVIVAPATPPGASALAIVRLSGPPGATCAVARRLVPSLPERPEPRRALVARFLDAAGRPLDEGVVLPWAAPHSATGEEVVELFCHGAPAIMAALLEAARAAGARPARPGEFTRRALANGKVDLAEAEGISRLVAAESRGAARRALGLVDGDLSRRVRAVREGILDLLAELEAGLDFPDDVGAKEAGALRTALERPASELRWLLAAAGASAGRERIPTIAVAGRPNAGKSTLFNALLGADRAIVTPHPGTTRDAVTESVDLAGARVRLADTAGLRETGDEVERIGVDVAWRTADLADVVLLVVDGSAPPAPEDRAIAGRLGDRAVVVRTKADLALFEPWDVAADAVVSARTGAGLDALRTLLLGRLGAAESEGGLLVLDRHREALARAAALLESAGTAPGEEVAASLVREALSALGEITGETATEELLDRIFSAFCIGK
jgi:tRNA modification GTPase